MRKVIAFGLVMVLALIGSSPARAHAQLVSSNPKVSAVLYVAPKSVTLTFDDDLIAVAGSNQIQVLDAKKQRIDRGSTKVSAATISVALKSNIAVGKYQVVYRVLSADGHPVSSSYYFYLKKR